MADANTRSGVGVSTVIGIVFVILKLVGVIGWSWLWVLAPFWIPLAIVIFLFALIFLANVLN